VEELTVDLKVVKTIREVSIGISSIAHGHKRKCKVIYLNILIKAISSRIVPY
jgi:hypothetical protein